MPAFLITWIISGGTKIIEKMGREAWNKIYTPLKRAKNAAIKRMASELGAGQSFPSEEFLDWNFRFDTLTAKTELDKLLIGDAPDEIILKKEMATEIAEKWPQLKDKADIIVESFLKYFEAESLANEELKGLALASIIKTENTATQKMTQKFVLESEERLTAQIAELSQKIEIARISQTTSSETEIINVVSKLEERLVNERDEIVAQLKKWQSKGLFERIQKLAEDSYKVRYQISREISASAFRLFGSHILRSSGNIEQAKKWVSLADGFEPQNPKTIALKAELLLRDKYWGEAKALLASIAETSTEPLVKLFYVEALSHLNGNAEAFKWLKDHSDVEKDDKDIKLNLAMLAVQCEKYDYASDILNKLKNEPYPGPYPYLLSAELHFNKSIPKELVTISTPADIDLIKNTEAHKNEIADLEKGIELLKLTSKPQKEIADFAHRLASSYLAIGLTDDAAKILCQYWRQLRKQGMAWFTAAAVIANKKNRKTKALVRGQKGVALSGENDQEAHFRYGLLCLNVEEWDKCLEAVNYDEKLLDENHLKAKLQLELICYFQKENYEKAEEAIKKLKDHFPKDELWVIHKSIMLSQQAGDIDAIKLLEEEIRNYPNSINIKLRLADLYSLTERQDRALILYKELGISLKNPKIIEAACMIAFNTKKEDEVLAIISEAEQNQIKTENLNHFKAIAYSINKEFDEAIDLFSTFDAATLSSNDYLFYALCYSSKANLPKAIALLKEGKKKYPDDARLRRALYTFYLEVNAPDEAFEEALFLLKTNPDDRAAYFAVMTTGFAIGRGEEAHKALMDYFSRFGEGPELKKGTIEEFKEINKVSSEKIEQLWNEYSKGAIPEVLLARNYHFGVGGYRIMLLESASQVMAFNGHPDSQKAQLLDTFNEVQIVIDYHALISLYLLDLIKPVLDLFKQILIPEAILNQLKEDLIKLPTSYQKDRRVIAERTFEVVQTIFKVHQAFPNVNLKEIPEAISNNYYDLTVCKEKHCAYVVPGFDNNQIIAMLTSGIEILTVLDLLDLIKDLGLISVKNYEANLEVLAKYHLNRHSAKSYLPARLMINWQAAEMLEECNLLRRLSSATELHVGPFTFALLKSEIENYKLQEKIHDTLSKLEAAISELIASDRFKIIPATIKERKIKAKLITKLTETEYIESTLNICKERSLTLWTDDLFTQNYFSLIENVKTTCTRTVLDVLLQKEIISQEDLIEKIAQLINWNMFFTWVNVDMIMKAAEMYSYSKSDVLEVLTRPVMNEIKKLSDRMPDQVESSNFHVSCVIIIKLWVISDKAQQLAMKIFDLIHDIVRPKPTLKLYWLVKCIVNLATVGEVPVKEFLQKLALRMPSMINDELKTILKKTIRLLMIQNNTFFESGNKRVVAGNLLRAVKYAIPNYYEELKHLALELDTAITAFL